ncbi:MAG TPA: PDZ domain-containing protein, partial [Pirellulales bacterium]
VLYDRYTDRLVVVRVLPDTPAFAAGLRAGDEIVSFHGQPISSVTGFAKVIHETQPGAVDFEFARGSNTMRAQARMSERIATRPENPATPPAQSAPTTPSPAAPSPAPGPGPAPGSTPPPPANVNPAPTSPGPAPAPASPAPGAGPVRRIIRGG